MKISFVQILSLIILCSSVLTFFFAKDKSFFTLKLNSNQMLVVCNFALVVITVFYSYSTNKMTMLAEEANKINFRPYLKIDKANLNAYSKAASNIPGSLSSNVSYGMLLFSSNDNNAFVYGIYNLGDVPAHIMENVVEVSGVNSDGTLISIKIPNYDHTIKSVIFPNDYCIRQVDFGKNVIFGERKHEKIIITMKTKYRNSDLKDSRVFFTIKKLEVITANTPYELNQNLAVTEIFTDEGLEK